MEVKDPHLFGNNDSHTTDWPTSQKDTQGHGEDLFQIIIIHNNNQVENFHDKEILLYMNISAWKTLAQNVA